MCFKTQFLLVGLTYHGADLQVCRFIYLQGQRWDAQRKGMAHRPPFGFYSDEKILQDQSSWRQHWFCWKDLWCVRSLHIDWFRAWIPYWRNVTLFDLMGHRYVNIGPYFWATSSYTSGRLQTVGLGDEGSKESVVSASNTSAILSVTNSMCPSFRQ